MLRNFGIIIYLFVFLLSEGKYPWSVHNFFWNKNNCEVICTEIIAVIDSTYGSFLF